MIPKIIHYCWLSGDPIPANLQKCMNSWKRFLPDYEFMLWDLKRFNIEDSIWVKQAFEAKKYAFAADYIRLYAVYTYGGIYMDMDVEVVKSFDSLLHREYILGYETETGIEAGVFGAPKGADWIKCCLQYYCGRTFLTEDAKCDIKPLPQIMFTVLKGSYLNKSIFPFPNEYLTAKSYLTGAITITDNTYSIHHFAGSWQPSGMRFKAKVMRVVKKSTLLSWIHKYLYQSIKYGVARNK